MSTSVSISADDPSAPAEHTNTPWQLSTPPSRRRSELLAKAKGAILVLLSLTIVWILSILSATKLAHGNLAGFNIFVSLQFLLWTLHRQGVSIFALALFDLYYTTPGPRSKKRPTLNLSTLDAWMSLIITPINILTSRLQNVLLVLIPAALSVFATFATTTLLGNEISLKLVDTYHTQKVSIGPAGAGSTHAYVMTGMEFIYNASNSVLAPPNSRFVHVMDHHTILIPSIPDVGTYSATDDNQLRAIRVKDIPALRANISVAVKSDREIFPDPEQSTVPNLGHVNYTAKEISTGKSLISLAVIIRHGDFHRQIYIDMQYQTVLADLVFATFDNGTHISSLDSLRDVSAELPERLRGEKPLSMENVVDNFILSQHGKKLSEEAAPNPGEESVFSNLGLLLAAAFGIRSAANQNFLDGGIRKEVEVLEERKVVIVPIRYWIVAGTTSILLVIACLMTMIRRQTINGNLVQLVSLLQGFIRDCPGACTPKWQVSYVNNRTFMEEFMHKRIALGYAADETGERAVFKTQTSDKGSVSSHHIAFDDERRLTKDKLNVLYNLLAGTCTPRVKAN